MKKKNVFRVAVLFSGFLFAYSAGAKICDFPAYRSRMEDLPLPGRIIQPLALLLPLVEILVVVLLIVPRLRVAGLISSLSLLIIFSLYLLYLTQYPVVSCACGGLLEQMSANWHLALNTGFILLGAAGLRYKLKHQDQPINAL
jgi:hypothetical protein